MWATSFSEDIAPHDLVYVEVRDELNSSKRDLEYEYQVPHVAANITNVRQRLSSIPWRMPCIDLWQ
jgi:hypothetical protein